VANLRRHPSKYITMDRAFEYTLSIPLREALAAIFIEHYDRAVEEYGADAHKGLLYEMGVEEVVRKISSV